MQEEVENRTVALAINTSKMTARVLQEALRKLLLEMRKSRDSPSKIRQGKQTIKQLIGQGAGVSNIEIADSNIKAFERVARKYSVDYALMKDTAGLMPKFLVFFKARDADALTAAFTEFSSKVLKRDEKPSLLAQLGVFKELVKSNFVDRARRKDKELAR